MQISTSLPSLTATLPSLAPLQTNTQAPRPGSMSAAAESFSAQFHEALEGVNTTMERADRLEEQFVCGQTESIHEVQIAGARADLAMKLTVTLASKLAHCATTLFQMQA